MDKTRIVQEQGTGEWLIWSHTGECIGRTNVLVLATDWCRSNGYDPFDIVPLDA